MSQTILSILTDLDEWTRGVLFPVLVAALLGFGVWVVKCLKAILNEFRATRAEVKLNTAVTEKLNNTVKTEVARLDTKLDEIQTDARERIEQVAEEAERAHDRIDRVLTPRVGGS